MWQKLVYSTMYSIVCIAGPPIHLLPLIDNIYENKTKSMVNYVEKRVAELLVLILIIIIVIIAQ